MEVSERDVDMGVAAMLERGLLPQGFDMNQFFGNGNAGPFVAGQASIHKHVDQFKRREVSTSQFGFGAVLQAKLDIAEIERLPAKASVAELLQLAKGKQASSSVTGSRRTPTPPPVQDPVAEGLAVPEAGPKKDREDPRTYTELLDLYSLHEFIIRKGKTLRNTPEFTSYKRSYTVQWGAIETVIGALEEFLASYGVSLAYIDGKRVAQLAILDLGIPSKEDLLSCIANRQEVEPLVISVVQQFRQGAKGHDVAATKIQSIWRMYRAQCRYEDLRIATAAAIRIQRQWYIHRAHNKTRKLIALNRESLHMKWKDTMDAFVRDWPQIRTSRRLVLHIPSLSLPVFQTKSIPYYDCMQTAQLMRLAELADPLVSIVLFAPFKIEKEAFQYYVNILKAAGVPNPEGRIILLVPENTNRLPPGLSLTKQILMSSKTMKLLGAMIKGKTTYIVPGIVSQDELLLASKLNIPLLAAEPRVAQVLGTKSGGKSVVELAEVATPLGAYHLKNTRDLFTVLSKCIVEYRDVARWLVKIDSESGSRGHAYFDVSRLRCVQDRLGASSGSSSVNVVPPLSADIVFRELSENAAKRVKMVHPHIYPEWKHFAEVFNIAGGCIEAVPSRVLASPTANLFIEPDGTIQLLSVVEQVFSPSLSVLGCSFPQVSVPHEAIRDAALSIAQAAFQRRVMGYLSIDFVVYDRVDVTTGERSLRLWAVDLDLYLTNNSCIHTWVQFLTGASYDAETGLCLLPQAAGGPSGGHHGSNNAPSYASLSSASSTPTNHHGGQQQLHYVYSGLIYNPYIGGIRHAAFFGLCRQRGLSFDIVTRTGVAFHLVDTLLKGCFGVISIGTSLAQCVPRLVETQQLLQAELPKDADGVEASNYSYFVAAVKHLLSRVNEKKGDRRRHHSLGSGLRLQD